MNEQPNPYSHPLTEAAFPNDAPPASQTLDFLPIMRRWERLRVIFNIALVLFAILITLVARPRNAIEIDFWFLVCVGGVVANLCFLIGPAVEAYGTRFRLWHPLMTPALFVAGLLWTAILATVCIVGYSTGF